MDDKTTALSVTGRCYCGKSTFSATKPPKTISYCHCSDCRRVTGAPVAAFAAFDDAAILFSPNEGQIVSINPGVTRTFCADCGSPITGRYDYLPGTVYISLGLLDDAEAFPPELHSHHGNKLTWLHLDDALERKTGSARSKLNT